MLKTVSGKNSEIFATHQNHFIILFFTLFSLLFVFTGWIYWDNLYIAFQQKFIVLQMEKKFGFRARREKMKADGYEHEYDLFYIESVEPGSLFELAGFQPGDTPLFSGCRFFVNGKTDEAMFYTQLNSIKAEQISVFTLANIDDYQRIINSRGAADLPRRRVYLTGDYDECLNPQ